MSKSRFTIVGLGEVLWDVFPDGARFGGAPANFACCARQLDKSFSDVFVVSAVGEDRLGNQAIAELTTRGVDAEAIQQCKQRTGQVDVILDHEKKASYHFIEDPAWDHLKWDERAELLARRTDAVCFGTLGQRSVVSREAIRSFLHAMANDSLKVLDLNLRPPFDYPDVIFHSLELANALKLNEQELPKLAELLDISGNQQHQIEQIKNRFQYKFVALTLGSEGSHLLTQSPTAREAAKVEVVDTVGAGDAFTAVLVIGYLHGLPWDEIHDWANDVAGYVASQPGATPTLPSHLCLPR